MRPYYLIIEEWNYPTESGREVHSETYGEDELDAAQLECLAMADGETGNFEKCTRQDALSAEQLGDRQGAIVTTKLGLDKFYYAARLVKVTPLYGGKTA